MYITGAESHVTNTPHEKLLMIINETVGNDVIWKEQCQLDNISLSEPSCKTRFVQIHSLSPNSTVQSGSVTHDNVDASNLPDPENEYFSDSLRPLPILKETAV